MDFSLCLKRNIKDDIMGKVHSNKDVNHNQSYAHFENNISHSQGSKNNMASQTHFDKNVSYS
jgi:hypothetical protein